MAQGFGMARLWPSRSWLCIADWPFITTVSNASEPELAAWLRLKSTFAPTFHTSPVKSFRNIPCLHHCKTSHCNFVGFTALWRIDSFFFLCKDQSESPDVNCSRLDTFWDRPTRSHLEHWLILRTDLLLLDRGWRKLKPMAVIDSPWSSS